MLPERAQYRRLDTKAGALDEVAWPQMALGSLVGVERADSMDVQNDPRFIASNVMDKRLGAFKSLTLVSGLMFGTSMSTCFGVKKDIDFSEYSPYVGYVGIWELLGFIVAFTVAAMCLISLYVISHQLFFCMRLKTAGVMGYEQATIFYLTRIIVIWRHFAMWCLFNGLWMFMILIGLELFIDFYKDAGNKYPVADASGHNMAVTKLWVTNLRAGNSLNATFIPMEKHHKLDMMVHTVLGYVILSMFFVVCIVLYFIHKHHVEVFQLNYKASKELSDPITNRVLEMGSRRGAAVQG
jgi:uncharacterized membrane protein (Fun14 family)